MNHKMTMIFFIIFAILIGIGTYSYAKSANDSNSQKPPAEQIVSIAKSDIKQIKKNTSTLSEIKSNIDKTKTIVWILCGVVLFLLLLIIIAIWKIMSILKKNEDLSNNIKNVMDDMDKIKKASKEYTSSSRNNNSYQSSNEQRRQGSASEKQQNADFKEKNKVEEKDDPVKENKKGTNAQIKEKARKNEYFKPGSGTGNKYLQVSTAKEGSTFRIEYYDNDKEGDLYVETDILNLRTSDNIINDKNIIRINNNGMQLSDAKCMDQEPGIASFKDGMWEVVKPVTITLKK